MQANSASYNISLAVSMYVLEAVGTTDCPANSATNVTLEICGSNTTTTHIPVYLTTPRAIHIITIGFV